MRPTIHLGKVRGVAIGIHWSLVVVGFLIASSLAGSLLPSLEPDAGRSYWPAAILATLLFFASILAHELAHALVAIRRGQRVEGITLWLLGGVASLRDEAPDARSEFLVAVAGPLTSIALGIGLGAVGLGLDVSLPDGSLLPAVALYIGVVNIVLALFNLLPGAPLDGGRILSAALWALRKDRRAAQIAAARVGFVLGGLLVGFGLLGFLTGRGYGDIWTLLVGWFVIDASRSEQLSARVARSLDGHTVADIMGPEPRTVPEWITLATFRAEFDPIPASVLLTGFDGAPNALVQTRELRSAPPGPRSEVRLRDVAIPLHDVPSVAPDTPALAALELGVPVVVAVAGRIVGVIGLDEVRRATDRDALKLAG